MKKLIILFTLILITGCAKKIYPTKPQSDTFTTIPAAKESKVILPLKTDIAALANKLNSEFPRGQIYNSGRQTSGNDKRYWIQLFREKDIVFNANQGYLKARIPIKAKAKASLKICAGWWRGHWDCFGGSHVQNGRTEANIAIDLLIKPKLNADYSVSTELSIDASVVGNANLEFYLLGFRFSIPIKSILQNKLNEFIRNNKPKIDQAVADAFSKIRIKQKVEKYWKLISTPIELGNTGLHLNSKPVALYFQNIHSENNELGISIGLGSKLEISESSISHNSPLPNISIIPAEEEGEVNLNIPITVSFNTLNQEIANKIKDTIISFKKYKFKIKDVTFSGYQKDEEQGVLTTVDFKCTKGFLAKGIKGKIHLAAIPAYDKDQDLLYVDSYKFSAETRNLLRDESVDFLANKVFYNKILEKLKIDFTEEKEKLEITIRKNIENYRIGNLKIQGNLKSIDLENIYINNENLKIVLDAKASIKSEFINDNESRVSSME